ncbi:MAG: hypothetical protein CO032_04565 [Nitrosopumilales archaeon CG_4_9_14_0_2_um_filter_34_16]|nr:MAG: hypothetical protein CO032_04565 [Nitrosopumilales archaeon CG_4_9_14_0_2_um_filter_34_16]
MTNFSCILFDLGGVLVNWDNLWIIQEVSEKFHLSENQLKIKFEKNLKDYSSGKFDEMEFWNKIGRAINSSDLENLEKSLYSEIVPSKISVNNYVYDISKKLKKSGYIIGIVSNTELAIYSLVEKIMPTTHFDYKFLSFQIGVVTPDVQIFEHVLEKLSMPKEKILYIDDDIKNIELTQSLGIDSIHFITNQKLSKELEKRNLS